ncbi:MAG: hypothetical protein AB1640_18090 [bacterium]
MDPKANETEDVYRELCVILARDIPEFYELARELFTEQEAAVAKAMPKGFNPACVPVLLWS